MAAALWQSIDMQQADGRLASCFKAADVAPSLVDNMMNVQKFKTLRDFAESYTEADYTALLDEIWENDEATKKTRVERGRLRSTWKAGSIAIAKLEESPKADGSNNMTTDISWEAPLTDDQRDAVWADWKTKYNIRLECHVRPGEPLVNRLYREFRTIQMSVHDVRKWKSLLLERRPTWLLKRE